MKKLLVALVVVLVLAGLVVPGAVGMMFERQIDAQMAAAIGRQPAGATLDTTTYERRWFGSHVVQQYTLAFPADRQGGPDRLNVVLSSEVTHGPAILSGGPALAVARSTLRFDLGDEAAWDLPGEVVTQFGFDGASRSHYTSGAVAIPIEAGGPHLNWGGADVTLTFNGDYDRAAVSGRVQAMSLATGEGSFEMGPVEMAAELTRDPDFGLWLGDQSLAVERLDLVEAESNTAVTMKNLSLRGSSALVDALMRGDSEFTVDSIAAGDMAIDQVRLSVTVDRIDAASLVAFQRASEQIQVMTMDPDNGGAIDPDVIEELMMEPMMGMLRRGPALSVDELRLRLPQGPVNMNLNLALTELPADAALDPLTLLTGLVGDSHLVVGKPVADLIARFDPNAGEQMRLGVAMGLLVDTGDNYEVVLKYQGGLLTVNGNPMPLPLNAWLGQ